MASNYHVIRPTVRSHTLSFDRLPESVLEAETKTDSQKSWLAYRTCIQCQDRVDKRDICRRERCEKCCQTSHELYGLGCDLHSNIPWLELFFPDTTAEAGGKSVLKLGPSRTTMEEMQLREAQRQGNRERLRRVQDVLGSVNGWNEPAGSSPEKGAWVRPQFSAAAANKGKASDALGAMLGSEFGPRKLERKSPVPAKAAAMHASPAAKAAFPPSPTGAPSPLVGAPASKASESSNVVVREPVFRKVDTAAKWEMCFIHFDNEGRRLQLRRSQPGKTLSTDHRDLLINFRVSAQTAVDSLPDSAAHRSFCLEIEDTTQHSVALQLLILGCSSESSRTAVIAAITSMIAAAVSTSATSLRIKPDAVVAAEQVPVASSLSPPPGRYAPKYSPPRAPSDARIAAEHRRSLSQSSEASERSAGKATPPAVEVDEGVSATKAETSRSSLQRSPSQSSVHSASGSTFSSQIRQMENVFGPNLGATTPPKNVATAAVPPLASHERSGSLMSGFGASMEAMERGTHSRTASQISVASHSSAHSASGTAYASKIRHMEDMFGPNLGTKDAAPKAATAPSSSHERSASMMSGFGASVEAMERGSTPSAAAHDDAAPTQGGPKLSLPASETRSNSVTSTRSSVHSGFSTSATPGQRTAPTIPPAGGTTSPTAAMPTAANTAEPKGPALQRSPSVRSTASTASRRSAVSAAATSTSASRSRADLQKKKKRDADFLGISEDGKF